jgi:hypothetical protein
MLFKNRLGTLNNGESRDLLSLVEPTGDFTIETLEKKFNLSKSLTRLLNVGKEYDGSLFDVGQTKGDDKTPKGFGGINSSFAKVEDVMCDDAASAAIQRVKFASNVDLSDPSIFKTFWNSSKLKASKCLFEVISSAAVPILSDEGQKTDRYLIHNELLYFTKGLAKVSFCLNLVEGGVNQDSGKKLVNFVNQNAVRFCLSNAEITNFMSLQNVKGSTEQENVVRELLQLLMNAKLNRLVCLSILITKPDVLIFLNKVISILINGLSQQFVAEFAMAEVLTLASIFKPNIRPLNKVIDVYSSEDRNLVTSALVLESNVNKKYEIVKREIRNGKGTAAEKRKKYIETDILRENELSLVWSPRAKILYDLATGSKIMFGQSTKGAEVQTMLTPTDGTKRKVLLKESNEYCNKIGKVLYKALVSGKYNRTDSSGNRTNVTVEISAPVVKNEDGTVVINNGIKVRCFDDYSLGDLACDVFGKSSAFSQTMDSQTEEF